MRILWSVLTVSFSLSSAFAETSPSLQGKVLDPSYAVIVGAHITAIPEGRNAGPTAISDGSGVFALALEPGKYTIKISAKDFLETFESIEIGSTPRTLDFMLHLAAVRHTVSVKGSASYDVAAISAATRTLTPLRDIPQSIAVIPQELIRDQGMTSVADVVRYVPGIEVHQGENNRDQVIIRGNSTSADFFLNGVRDDVQYYRDLYNIDRVEALKGPNAMIFGRGGGGGVLNRVTKEAGFFPLRAATFQGGRFGNMRFTGDFNHPLSAKAGVRLNGIYENSDSFRRFVSLERGGINPTLTVAFSDHTRLTASYEYLRDTRVADRGITSYQGRPAAVDLSTFYGNPDDSQVRAEVHLASTLLEHRLGRFTLRNRTLLGSYDRFYQNYVPGAVSVDRTSVALTAYNNATRRKNVFNQTDLVSSFSTADIRHTVLVGTEFGRQFTDNFRNTGFFNNTSTTLTIPFESTLTTTAVTYRQSATDADNHVEANVAAAFAQDQVELSEHLEVIGGIRYDRFDLRYRNNRNNDSLRRADNLVSPRIGVVIKPATVLSLYGHYGVSYLPGSGDQFASLTTITQQVKPEKFNNYEAGVKWDLFHTLSLTASVYRLDRINTRSTDPNDPTRIVQTGSHRTKGFEWSATGMLTERWQVLSGYSYQDAFVSSPTTAAKAGARLGQVPRHTVSFWNNYKFFSQLSAGLGLIGRSKSFATIDNTVTLPGYFRADAALYADLTENIRLQGNLENVLNRRYFSNADSNTNISPGSPRALKIVLSTRF